MLVENLFSKRYYGTQKKGFSPFLWILFSCKNRSFARMPPAGFRGFEVGEHSEVGVLESLTSIQKKCTIFKISSFRLDPYLTHYNIIFDNYLLIFFKLWSKISNDGKN